MKNITISLPDEDYCRARVAAAQRNTSVSALVREFLLSLTEGESDFARRKRLQNEAIASIGNFRGSDRLEREKVHDRDALR